MHDCSVQYASLPYKFTCKERDSESGLDNFGKRYFGSSLGRFQTPDPVLVSWRRMVNPKIGLHDRAPECRDSQVQEGEHLIARPRSELHNNRTASDTRTDTDVALV
jgi:RHS repeat-associated protein